MPTFYTEDLEIDVDEFISSCSGYEIDQIIKILIEEDYIKPNSINNEDKLGFTESEFFKKLDKLKDVYYTIDNEDLEVIDKMLKKYC
jgi:hypothetical protein